ncbi:MAG TPA: GlsB/YeaQ/YmgE family stress response membrane protein [Terriglobales bacterium]|nr:GlsB/YeaQ/YmgE family stress response membrane protein [Terriglobales bacterium]
MLDTRPVSPLICPSVLITIYLHESAYTGSDGSGEMFWLLWLVIVGLIAGWATGKIMKGSGYGVGMDILLGIVGGIIGGWIIRLLGFQSSGGLIPSILVAILGAVILVWLVRKFRRQ